MVISLECNFWWQDRCDFCFFSAGVDRLRKTNGVNKMSLVCAALVPLHVFTQTTYALSNSYHRDMLSIWGNRPNKLFWRKTNF